MWQRRDSITKQLPFIIIEGQRGPILFDVVNSMFLDAVYSVHEVFFFNKQLL